MKKYCIHLTAYFFSLLGVALITIFRPIVSKSSIYEYIHRDKTNDGEPWKHCRFKRKHRKRPIGKYSPIKNRVGIEERPAEADGTKFGDWEMDLIVGPGNKGAKLTLVERSLSFAIIRNLPCGKVPSEVAKVVVDALLPFKRCGAVKTITTDNGPEFAEHKLVSKNRGVTIYFADPYSSLQKGLIKNTNMLIRQYIPRDDNFSTLTDEQVVAIQYKINRRPRKKLGFASHIRNYIYLCKLELRFGLESLIFTFFEKNLNL